MEAWRAAWRNFRELSFAMQLLYASGFALLFLNIILFTSYQPIASLKIDSGIATLVGAIVGLCVVAWQTSRGFQNLIKSQENQAQLARDARLHQVELDEQKAARAETRAKQVLVAALWAEVAALHRQAHEARSSSLMMKAVAESMKRDRILNTSSTIGFSAFDAPIFRSNIQNLGLLGASLASDVVSVTSRANGQPIKVTLETPPSYDLLISIYTGNAETMEDWREDLKHVANRLSAAMNGSADPGTLQEDKKRRGAAKKSAKQK